MAIKTKEVSLESNLNNEKFRRDLKYEPNRLPENKLRSNNKSKVNNIEDIILNEIKNRGLKIVDTSTLLDLMSFKDLKGNFYIDNSVFYELDNNKNKGMYEARKTLKSLLDLINESKIKDHDLFLELKYNELSLFFPKNEESFVLPYPKNWIDHNHKGENNYTTDYKLVYNAFKHKIPVYSSDKTIEILCKLNNIEFIKDFSENMINKLKQDINPIRFVYYDKDDDFIKKLMRKGSFKYSLSRNENIINEFLKHVEFVDEIYSKERSKLNMIPNIYFFLIPSKYKNKVNKYINKTLEDNKKKESYFSINEILVDAINKKNLFVGVIRDDDYFLRLSNKILKQTYKDSYLILEPINFDFKKETLGGLEPQSLEQVIAFDALSQTMYDGGLVVLSGSAGAGKSLLALASSFNHYFIQRAKQRETSCDNCIGNHYIAKPIIDVGKQEVGFLPGKLSTKIGPRLNNFEQLWNIIIKNLEPIERVRKTNKKKKKKKRNKNVVLEIRPNKDFYGLYLNQDTNLIVIKDIRYFSRIITFEDEDYNKRSIFKIINIGYLRGLNFFEGDYTIIDEGQNLDRDTIKTIISRMHDSSTMIITGDENQVDNYKLRRNYNGILLLFDKYLNLINNLSRIKDQKKKDEILNQLNKIYIVPFITSQRGLFAEWAYNWDKTR